MTVEADLFSTLRGFVANRVFPDFAPEGTVTPFVVYQQIGGAAPAFLERALVSRKNGRFQVAVWAATRAEAASIALQIENAMTLATVFQVEVIGAPTATFDEDTQLRGSRQDFGIWSQR